MDVNERICALDLDALKIIKYPDPRLREVCTSVSEVDEAVRQLVYRMLDLMFEGQGIGLAAPQVGVTARIFVASPSFDEDDFLVYINPEIIDAEGSCEADEGCLSLPGLTCSVKRSTKITIRALDIDGEEFEEVVEEPPGRAFRQHEMDHLNGITLADKLSTVGKIANRVLLKELEKEFGSNL